MHRLLLLYWPALLATIHFSCAPAPEYPPASAPLTVDSWEKDTSYFTLAGEPALLLGFDLRGLPLDTNTLVPLTKRLAANGGNYLLLEGNAIDQEWLRTLYGLGAQLGVRIDTTTEVRGFLPSASVAEFSARLLGGSPAGGYRQPVQAALNSMRAVRTVERHLPFWNLKIDQTLLGRERPSGTVAAADSLDNYVIYIPDRGAVTINFRDSSQVARRVTVVGHLGTQRSEILQPPYDRSFTLMSNEERGGWLLIEKL